MITKYIVEDARFLFRADYDAELNILYNHYEDKHTKEIFVSDNHGVFKGRVKFNPESIDTYIAQAIGAAFPILVDGLGFVFTYNDLEARKTIIGDVKFNEVVAANPRLARYSMKLGDHVKVVYRVETVHNFDTGEQQTRVVFDNTEDNWWSAQSTPSYVTDDVLSREEQDQLEQSLSLLMYLNPIERYIWDTIAANG